MVLAISVGVTVIRSEVEDVANVCSDSLIMLVMLVCS